MIKIGIIGASGYGGIELVRLLENHPRVKVCKIVSGSHEKQDLADIYPHFSNIFEQKLTAINQLAKEVDLIFFATPAGISSTYIPQFLDSGIKCIDLSGDFRLKDPHSYPKWYNHQPPAVNYLQQAVYGLSELHSKDIYQADLIANPGCYPTAALLAIVPALAGKLIKPASLIIDGKSGVSGAGRSLSLNTHFSEVNENIKAYKFSGHQHIPEIEQELDRIADMPISITFTTHLIPITRGMMCTIYADMNQKVDSKAVFDCYQEFYHNQMFIRIRKDSVMPAAKEVLGSNYCDIGLIVDKRTERLMIVSVIDNLIKGAAGQAVQNMNLQYGWDQSLGLNHIPMYP